MAHDAARAPTYQRHLLLNVASNYFGQLITIVVGFLLTPFILRNLGGAVYGMWVLVGAVVAYGNLLDFGITSAVTKYIAEYRAKGELEQVWSLISTALLLAVLLGVAVLGCGLIGAPFFPRVFNIPPGEHELASSLVVLASLGIGISIPSMIISSVFRGMQRFDLSNLLGVIGTLVSAGLVVLVLSLGGNVLGIALSSIAVTLVMQVVSVLVIRQAMPELRFGWQYLSLPVARTLLSFSWSLFVVNVATQLQSKTDEIVIGLFLPIQLITSYTVARRLSEMPQILASQFIKIILPVASELDATDDNTRLRAVYIASTRITLAIFVPFACVLIVLAQAILTLWVGEAYAGSAHIVLILGVASLVDIAQWPASLVLQGMSRHRPLAVVAIIAGLANLALSIYLAQALGTTGVALGTLIAALAESLCVVMPYTLRALGVRLREMFALAFIPSLVPALPMLVVLNLLLQHGVPSSLVTLGLTAAAGFLVYIAGYFAFGASAQERALCRAVSMRAVRMATVRLRGE